MLLYAKAIEKNILFSKILLQAMNLYICLVFMPRSYLETPLCNFSFFSSIEKDDAPAASCPFAFVRIAQSNVKTTALCCYRVLTKKKLRLENTKGAHYPFYVGVLMKPGTLTNLRARGFLGRVCSVSFNLEMLCCQIFHQPTTLESCLCSSHLVVPDTLTPRISSPSTMNNRMTQSDNTFFFGEHIPEYACVSE